ncbi:MAG: RNA polymerase sigma factor [Bacteroidota bacterium]|nr:RNA polymerase sigma factor [Bacteroidota bacterium]
MQDTQLFSSIFKYHFDSLYNYGIKITNDSEVVKDCIQELFFRIWKNNIDLARVQYLKSYLFTGLRRQILNILELKYYQVDKIKLEDHFLIEFSPEDYFIQQQFEDTQRKNVIQALNKLSNKQREAIYLRYFEELEYTEIAKVMNVNLQSAKNTVSRGLDALRELLALFLFFTFLEESLT